VQGFCKDFAAKMKDPGSVLFLARLPALPVGMLRRKLLVFRTELLIMGMQMCQMVASNRPSALNILDEVKKWNRWPHP